MGRGEGVDSGGRLRNRTGLEKGIEPRRFVLSTPGPERMLRIKHDDLALNSGTEEGIMDECNG